jgi:hypothetical protein
METKRGEPTGGNMDPVKELLVREEEDDGGFMWEEEVEIHPRRPSGW